MVDRLKQDFDIEDTWIPHELHPETPTQGQLLEELFEPFEIDQMLDTLRRRGKPYGIEFGELRLMCNTRQALEAAEHARTKGHYEAFHTAVFRGYFTEGRDIGNRNTLLDIARSVGLNGDDLADALDNRRYSDTVKRGSKQAKERGVTALPSFFIKDMEVITGAVPEEVFRNALHTLQNS